MYKNYDDTVRELTNNGGIIKDRYIGHAGYVILWFDLKGYSITEFYRHGGGTSGILTWDNAKQDFVKKVTLLINSD